MKPTLRLTLVAGLGGALGACLRFALGEAAPDGDGFPTTTFAINVVGALALAALPALAVVRRSRAWTVALGPGVLGGFTTLSATSEQGRALLDDGRGALAAVYLVGTLAAALVAVRLASLLDTQEERDLVAAEGGDE